MMMNAPRFAEAEPVHYTTGYGFDPGLDFSQFLEEARKNRASVVYQQASFQPHKKMPSKEKKNKSWKTSLFSWLKVDKKSRSSRGSTTSPYSSNLKPESLSGPIYGSGRKTVPAQQYRRPTSGPITNHFTPTRGGEVKIPYMSLDHVNHPPGSQAYGPVYLVT